MVNRVSINEIYSQINRSIGQNFGRLNAASRQLATGQRIERPSDDNVGTRRILSIDRERAQIERYIDSVSKARGHLDAGSASLLEVSSAITRIRELTVQGANGTLGPNDRAALGQEVDALLATIVQNANVKVEGRFFFSGTASSTIPFRVLDSGDGLRRVAYGGNHSTQDVEVGPGIYLPTNTPGEQIFAGGARTSTLFEGLTGATPSGSGLDSGTGRDLLLVRHSASFFGAAPLANGQDPATGLRPGVGSPVGDTVLGSGHNVVLSTDAAGGGIINLDGGADYAFGPGTTNLAVDGPNGERIYVDLTGVAPNLSSVLVPLRGDGTLSTDGGATSVPINFGNAAQQVIDSETGSVLHVNSTGIRLSGTEAVSYEGTFDLFATVIAIGDILRDPSISGGEANGRLNRRLEDLDRNLVSLTSGLSALGSRSSQLDLTENRLSDLDVTLTGLRSEIAEVDFAEVTLKQKAQERLYQASLFLAARVNDLSLLNYL